MNRSSGRQAGRAGNRQAGKVGRRRVWFGPGTILALLIAGAALALRSTGTDADTAASAGRVIFEADRDGKMRRVEAPSAGSPETPVRPLWKPDVALLLEPRSGLTLTARQRESIRALDAGWQRDRGDLEAAMRGASAEAASMLDRREEGRGASLVLLRRGLGHYSALSREYDARRADYWKRGYTLLSATQKAQVDRLAVGTPSGRVK